jgi:molybdenum cofactor cytidylyltransferase
MVLEVNPSLRPTNGCRVAGVVLAAGSSSRFGRNKLLVEIDGEVVVRRAARRALEAGLLPVVVVLGFEGDLVARALDGLSLVLTVNQNHTEGMHTSLRAGIARVPDDCEAVVVILADMPLVTSAMSAALVTRFQEQSAPLVVSHYGGVQAPPTLYARALFPALAVAGEGGGQQIVRDHRDQATVIEWPLPLLADLDRLEDVERLRSAVRD